MPWHRGPQPKPIGLSSRPRPRHLRARRPKAKTTDLTHLSHKNVEALRIALKRNRAEANALKSKIEEIERTIERQGLQAGEVCKGHATNSTHVRYSIEEDTINAYTKQELLDLLVKVRVELWGNGHTLQKDLDNVILALDNESE